MKVEYYLKETWETDLIRVLKGKKWEKSEVFCKIYYLKEFLRDLETILNLKTVTLRHFSSVTYDAGQVIELLHVSISLSVWKSQQMIS